MIQSPAQLSRLQQVSLVLLRTLIGWHFLYEGYFKLLRPAWTRAGAPLAGWTSADYLNAATGPLAWIFRAAAGSPWLPWIDTAVAAALVAVGLLLILGLYTQAACTGALLLLALFYLSAIPTRGLPEPRTEGAYLLVNKNLVEAIAVLVVLAFRTGRIGGLDRLRAHDRNRSAPLRTDEALV